MKRFRTFLVIAMLGVSLVAVEASSASAAVHHPFLSSFNGIETPGGSMNTQGVAVDNSASAAAGDVYVLDAEHSVVDRFEGGIAPGTFLGSITGPPEGLFTPGIFGQPGVNANGDLFVGDTAVHAVDEFSPTGVYVAPQILLSGPLGTSEPDAVAANGAGELLITAFNSNAVYKYDPGTSALSVFATGTAEPEGGFGFPQGVAVDNDPSSPASGDVYVVDSGKLTVDVFDSKGTYLSQLTGTPAGPFPEEDLAGAAVDPATGDLYVGSEHAVDEFSPTGVFISETRLPEEAYVHGVAIDAKTGHLYAGAGEHGVDVFDHAVTVADANISEATEIEPTSITVNGTVDPVGGPEVTSCRFEYGNSTNYGESAPCAPATPYSVPTAVSAHVTGLTPDTIYHVRIIVGNSNGTNFSQDITIETLGPPSIGEQYVDGITHATAVLHGNVNPHGNETTYHFEYGSTESYGSSTPDAVAGAGVTEVPVSAELSGLQIGATYHYRLVVSGDGSVLDGPDGTFTTEPVASVEGMFALAGPHDATLKAKIDDFGISSSCEVEYVTESQFASNGYAAPTLVQCTPQQLTGSSGELHAIARPTGLTTGTTYHFRFLVSNEYGEQRSPDETVTTFGLASFSMEDQEQESHPYTQAGGHPYLLTTNIKLITNTAHNGLAGPAGSLRDVRVHLPAGLIGNPLATEKCTRHDSERQACAGTTQVGEMTVQLAGNGSEPLDPAPLYNVVPPRGVAAEFSARFSKIGSAFIDGSVRTGSDYGLDADSLDITTLKPVVSIQVRIWGVPGDPSHDAERFCAEPGGYIPPPCSTTNATLRPFLTNPTSCSGQPLVAGIQADAYQAPGEFAELSSEMPAMTGCERLPFTPTITVQPEASAADSPTGLHVDLHIPQEENASGVAEAHLKDATVTLPAGVTINPANGGGLTGCSEAQIELHGPEPAKCPDASTVGTVELTSPLVNHTLHGSVYVAQQGNGGAAQGSNPFGSLLAIYIGIDDPETGVVVKVAGKVTLDPETGRLTNTFSNLPQLPFEDMKLDFVGGPRAPLVTPTTCGSYDASTSLASWAEPGSGVSPPIQPFTITSGPGASPCPSGAFAPAFTAGTQSAQAGSFTPFVLSFSRQDGEQGLSGLEATLAPGLLAKLAGVPLCGSPEVAAGACPAGSQIGTVTAFAGAGPAPISVQGQVYLTGSYNGGPFGEVVEVPAVAGPFNLGTVVVRGSIRINPSTAQATVVSDPFPTMLQGVRLTLKRVIVTLDRPGFSFNPTDCNQLAVTGTITGTGGASAPVSSPFEVANCAKLPFHPKFSASITGHASKANGAGLTVKVTSKGGPQPGGGEANIAKVKVALPIQLPSRLSTLQKACVAHTFEANPAACPADSNVGSATAVTPVLAKPLSGPAYLVSHGGAAFPDLEIVLQGEGITLILDGNTQIKKGITSSTFRTVPDAPISSFALVLPEGPHSVLGTNLPAKTKYNLCGRTLNMPTVITGQNGAVVKQTTKITPTGCPKKHKAKKAKRGPGKGKRH